MTTTLPTLFDWQAARDSAMKQVSDNAGPNFKAEALKFVVKFLRENGEQSGEACTDACKRAGIKPDNSDRAFGPVYALLLRDRIIERVGFCLRKKGNGTMGGSIYRLTK